MNKIVSYIIGMFFIVGGIDYIIGSPLKLGHKFEEGIKTMGALALGMIGIYSMAPFISDLLSAAIIPACKKIGMDPSIITSSFLAVDMGGYQIAGSISHHRVIALFSGVIVASTLGASISFSIPVALGMLSDLSDEEFRCFSEGILIGIITIPIGCVAAGIFQRINIGYLLFNMIPIFMVILVLAFALIKAPEVTMKLFGVFGKFIVAVSIFGIILQGIYITFNIKLIKDMVPISKSAAVVCKIALVLAGAYPMLEFISRIFKNSFDKLGHMLEVNSAAVAGIFGNLATNLLIFGDYKNMNPKGKVLCGALAISGAFVFGGQFGFVAGVAPEMIGAYFVAKFTSAIFSVIFVIFYYNAHSVNKVLEVED
ncbi:ethanolamine utilization protein EutH [Clostridium oryzae]|uniref:Ethanolamine utilization protein, EutH n=1 Tax=Clostridium oryzae TaxID=1450648 RepID=A0A1V4IE18_9CLOT|nr:ethanolamine utilization protein EutH [Clostridium oryzae]OPJ58169.1 ethanolamine utilization protein, EutH [Clostridium oryzae]